MGSQENKPKILSLSAPLHLLRSTKNASSTLHQPLTLKYEKYFSTFTSIRMILLKNQIGTYPIVSTYQV